jgi:phosphohistidine phosphatase
MKTLFLLRHAKASNDDPTLADIDRPLSERGFSDARIMSETLRQQDLVPEKIISSNAVRAYTTAFIFAATFEKTDHDIDRKISLYDCSEQDYFDAISVIDEIFSSCMITGHNETITQVAELLLKKTIEPLKTCGLVIISSESKTWSGFSASPCKLVLSLYPSLLK